MGPKETDIISTPVKTESAQSPSSRKGKKIEAEPHEVASTQQPNFEVCTEQQEKPLSPIKIKDVPAKKRKQSKSESAATDTEIKSKSPHKGAGKDKPKRKSEQGIQNASKEAEQQLKGDSLPNEPAAKRPKLHIEKSPLRNTKKKEIKGILISKSAILKKYKAVSSSPSEQSSPPKTAAEEESHVAGRTEDRSSVTQEVETSGTPVQQEPATPAAPKPEAPAATKPEAPAATKPEAPAAPEPMAQAAPEPMAQAAPEPMAQAVPEPEAPAVKQNLYENFQLDLSEWEIITQEEIAQVKQEIFSLKVAERDHP